MSDRPGQSINVNCLSFSVVVVSSYQFKSDIYSMVFVTDLSLAYAKKQLVFILGSDPVIQWQKVLFPAPVPPITQITGYLFRLIICFMLSFSSFD